MKYFHALNKINGIGSQKLKLLADFFGDGEEIWKSDRAKLEASGIGEKAAALIVKERNKINPDEEWEKLKKENIRLLKASDPNYPRLLREIPAAPFLLYVRGSFWDFNAHPIITIVGSRKLTNYGRQIALSLSGNLARAGVIVASGMALGIDAVAHRGALDAGGKTIAILGSGLDDSHIGPVTNFHLSREIMENGALISEYPPGIAATAGTFPARNRIMAGISLGTVVVEAAIASGTIITANLALEFNREIFAVPGSVFSPVSQGTNALIKAGAKLVSGAQDILEELNLEKIKTAEKIKKIIPDNPEEEKIIKVLSAEPLHIDRIIKLTKLKANIVSSSLSIMEMKGMIKDMGGQNYIRI